MGSKVFLLLIGLSIASVLLISSEVAARDLAETNTKTHEEANLDYGSFTGPNYGPVPPSHYTCYGACSSAAEAQALKASTTQISARQTAMIWNSSLLQRKFQLMVL